MATTTNAFRSTRCRISIFSPAIVVHVLSPAAAVVLLFLSSLNAFVLPVVSTLQYDVGTTYEYEYVATVRLTEPRAKASEVSYQVASTVQVSPVWQNPADDQEKILVFKIVPRLRVKPKGEKDLVDHASPLDTRTQHPVVAVTNGGQLTKFYAASDEDEDLLNLKRGLVSLFQMQNNEKEEVDASGKCKVTYKVAGKSIRKFKNGCQFVSSKENYSHFNQVLGVELKSHLETTYDIAPDNSILQKAESKERLILQVESLSFAAAVIHSGQKITLMSQKDSSSKVTASSVAEAIQAITKELGVQLVLSEVTLTETTKTCTDKCKSFAELVKEYKEAMLPKNTAKLKAAAAFLRLLHQCRETNKQDIIKVLQSPNNKNILASLLEVVATAQTPAALEAAIWVIPSVQDLDAVERFLLAVATAPRPSSSTITELTKLVQKKSLKSPKALQTAQLILGSVVKNYCQNKAHNCAEDKVVHGAMALLTSGLEKCTDDPCHLIHLRALQNAACPHTVPVLLQYAAKGGKKSMWALRALRALPKTSITPEVKATLLKIYSQLQRKYDSSSRLRAADILLTNDASAEEVKIILSGLSSFDEPSTYLLERIREIMQSNSTLSEIVNNILRDPKLGNYHVLSQPGISAAFTKLLAGNDETNSTYGVHLELANGGILKQSSFDVDLNNEDSTLQLMSFGLFAGGLSQLAGGDTTAAPEEDDSEDATAGVELSVMGVALRPYVFFVGQGELMGHVWSGTASELTPILQGTTILHDFSQQVALQSGLMLSLRVTGALSVDLSGSVQISLWSRNSHSVISARSAMLVQGFARIDTNFITSNVDLAVASEGKLEFITDSEFAETPFKMCTQMSQPSFPFRYTVRKVEHIPHSKHQVRRSRKRSYKIHGRSFSLHPKNNALCEIMLKAH